MKKIILLFVCLLMILISISSSAQNLVPNPSFEEYDTCPNFENQVNYAIGWISNGYNTPDYFNFCAPNTLGNSFSVPQNSAGYQVPKTGNAYCGLYTQYWLNPSYREYIGTQLNTQLNIGTKYFISWYVNLSNNVTCGTNKMGILFSTIPYNFNASNPTYKNVCTTYSENIIMDTVNWTKIIGSFISDSAYKYISIGNFFDNNNTDTTIFSNTNCVAYYYIDDVCVSKDSLTCNQPSSIIENTSFNIIEIFPNPAKNYITVVDAENNYFFLYNSFGQIVLREKIIDKNQKISFNLSPGIYFYLIDKSKGKIIIE